MERKTMSKPIAEAASARPRRTPVGTRNRLSVPNQEAGYVYRIVNDEDDRVSQMLEQGYEVVPNTKVGDKRVDLPSATGSASVVSVGRGMSAVVMRQRKEWYDEDQRSKLVQVDAIEETMRGDLKTKSDYGEFSISK